MITKEELYDIIDSYESYDLEFKSAKGGVPGSFWESYSSFANTQGGVVFLGVKETENGFKIDGLDKISTEKYKKTLWDALNNKNKVSANILSHNSIGEIETESGYVLFIEIPRADLRQRPIYIDNNPEKVFKREHEGDYECTQDEIRRMYAEANVVDCPIDSRIMDDFSFEEDIDMDSLHKYRQIFTNRHLTHPWSTYDDKKFLEELGGIRYDRKEKKNGLTLAGLLMFGKFSSIIDNYCCPSFFPDYRETAPESDTRWTDRICYDGTWETNLFNFYNKVYNKLIGSLPKPFALKDGIRVEDSPMHIAIREAFVNCLIHCDYTVNSNIVILNEGSRFVFSNPGSLLITMDQFRHGGESVCRNKSLQKMFMFIGAAEKAGSGADKIWEGWKSSNYRNPYLDQSLNKVSLELPFVSILSEDVIEGLKKRFGPNISSIEHEKLLVLAACYNDRSVSNASLQTVIDLHPSDITTLLKEMVSEKYLTPHSHGKGTKYEFASKTDTFIGTLFPEETDDISKNDTSIIFENDASSRVYKPTVDLYAKVGKFCKEYRSVTEISEAVNRSVSHIKNKIIPELIKQGKLKRLYPENPTHPEQKYIAVKK